MDDFTAEAGLTRGALYHHFGDKKGLFEAVIAQIDCEMAARLNAVSAKAETRWQGFMDENIGYVEMALDPVEQIDCRVVIGRQPSTEQAQRQQQAEPSNRAAYARGRKAPRLHAKLLFLFDGVAHAPPPWVEARRRGSNRL